MKLRAIGYWRSIRDDDPRLPDPREFVDPEWDPEAREALADYLRSGRVVRSTMGHARCRLCGATGGNDEQTDGTYLWPERLAHYVTEHSVRLPAEFLAHVERQRDEASSLDVEREWWSDQRGTTKARHWIRWRVDIGPCDVRATSVIQQIAGGVIGWDRAERLYGELAHRGKAHVTLTERRLAREIHERLSGARVACALVEERVPVPDRLLG